MPLDLYTFEVTIAADGRSATLSNQQDTPTALALCYSDCIREPTAAVYTGKLNDKQWAEDEMVTLVIPAGFGPDAPVGLFYQWTVDAKGVPKRNQVDVGTLNCVQTLKGGDVTGIFKASVYTYQLTFPADEKPASINFMTNDCLKPHTISLERATCVKSRGGCKKVCVLCRDDPLAHLLTTPYQALIARFDNGSDTGIFMVRDMLTKYLGFEAGNVEMLYYDVDVENGAKSLIGCHPAPTAAHFREKFVELLAGAQPGDVRFLYVDAQGTQKGGDECKPDDGKDGGWMFAEGDCGSKKELVTNGWISEAIRKVGAVCSLADEVWSAVLSASVRFQNIKPGISLTILAPSCLGGGIIDTTMPTPGVLLAGCHEMQSTTKALKVGDEWVDPWTYVITKIVARRVKRGVPTYTALFEEAKAFIKRLVDCGCELDRNKYLGPSPDERHPEAQNEACPCHKSHQEPQLIFGVTFVNPDAERFLWPIAAHSGCDCGATGVAKVMRFPRDA